MTFQPGQSGNPKGRRPGVYSLKTKIIKYLKEHPEAEEKVIKSLATSPQNHQKLFSMIDSAPAVQVDANVKVQPIPILPHVRGNKRSKEDKTANEED